MTGRKFAQFCCTPRYHFKCFLNTNLNKHSHFTQFILAHRSLRKKYIDIYSKETSITRRKQNYYGESAFESYTYGIPCWRNTHQVEFNVSFSYKICRQSIAVRHHTPHPLQICIHGMVMTRARLFHVRESIFFNVLFIWHAKAYLRVLFCLVGKKYRIETNDTLHLSLPHSFSLEMPSAII